MGRLRVRLAAARVTCALCVLLATWLCPREGRAAGYSQQEVADCIAAINASNNGSFSCKLCGVPVHCDGIATNTQTCSWGSLSGSPVRTAAPRTTV